MDAEFKRNYRNKIKILTRQIIALKRALPLPLSATLASDTLSSAKHTLEKQTLLDSLRKLRQELKNRLKKGMPFEVSVAFYKSKTRFSFFRQPPVPETETPAKAKPVKKNR